MKRTLIIPVFVGLAAVAAMAGRPNAVTNNSATSVTNNDATSPLDHTVMAADTSRVVDLDEVVVVAQPKEGFLLRQQPMSSSAFGSREMQQLNVRSLSQLSDHVPSFAMPSYGSRLTSSMYIRGIGSRVNNSAVGIYYDHIPLMSKSAYNTHFYMLDRVDVLRGPQGTLYGANSEGGIVRIYSKNPMSYQGTDLNLGIGTGFYRKVEVAHYHRPSDKLAFMAAGFYNGQNGFFRNTVLNERNDRLNEAGAKLRLMWKPTSRLTLDLTSDYQWAMQTAFPYGLYDEATGETADPATTFTNSYRRQMVNSGLTVSYDFGRLLLTSTTSHQYLWDRMKMDQDYQPEDYMRIIQTQKMNAITQEFTLRSKTAGRWQHTTGVFDSYRWLHTLGPVYFGDAMGEFIMAQWGMPAQAHSFLSFANHHVPGDFRTPQYNLGIYHESNFLVTDRLKLTAGLRYDYTKVKIDYSSQAMFDLNITMGRPVTHSFLSDFTSSAKNSYSQWLPKFGITYTVDSRGSNVYGVISKGYMAGGYNLQGFSDIFMGEERSLGHELRSMMAADYIVEHTPEQVEAVNRRIAFKPEESWNFEVGTHLNLFDAKVKADIALFYTSIRNQQITRMSPDYGFGRITDNAGKSNSYGLEMTLRGQAFDDHLAWGASYSYTHATFSEYDDYQRQDDDYVLISYKDNYVPFVPMHKMSLSGDYRVDIKRSASLSGDGRKFSGNSDGRKGLRSITFGLSLTGQGKTYWEPDNRLSQNFYALLGAHIAFDLGCATLDVWGRNLTDTNYHTFLVSGSFNAAGIPQQFAQLGNPLQVGLDVRFHF